MPRFMNMTCTVNLGPGNTPLKEYGALYGDGTVETYIIVPNSDLAFSVRLQSHEYIAPGLAVFVYIDGKYQCNRNRRDLRMPGPDVKPQEMLVDFRCRQKEEKTKSGRFIGHDWTFAKLDVATADKASEVDADFANNVGTIEVVVVRTTHDGVNIPTPDLSSSDFYDDRSPRSVDELQKTTNAQKVSKARSTESTGMLGGMFGLFDGACDEPDFGLDGVNDDQTPRRKATPAGLQSYYAIDNAGEDGQGQFIRPATPDPGVARPINTGGLQSYYVIDNAGEDGQGQFIRSATPDGNAAGPTVPSARQSVGGGKAAPGQYIDIGHGYYHYRPAKATTEVKPDKMPSGFGSSTGRWQRDDNSAMYVRAQNMPDPPRGLDPTIMTLEDSSAAKGVANVDGHGQPRFPGYIVEQYPGQYYKLPEPRPEGEAKKVYTKEDPGYVVEAYPGQYFPPPPNMQQTQNPAPPQQVPQMRHQYTHGNAPPMAAPTAVYQGPTALPGQQHFHAPAQQPPQQQEQLVQNSPDISAGASRQEMIDWCKAKLAPYQPYIKAMEERERAEELEKAIAANKAVKAQQQQGHQYHTKQATGPGDVDMDEVHKRLEAFQLQHRQIPDRHGAADGFHQVGQGAIGGRYEPSQYDGNQGINAPVGSAKTPSKKWSVVVTPNHEWKNNSGSGQKSSAKRNDNDWENNNKSSEQKTAGDWKADSLQHGQKVSSNDDWYNQKGKTDAGDGGWNSSQKTKSSDRTMDRSRSWVGKSTPTPKPKAYWGNWQEKSSSNAEKAQLREPYTWPAPALPTVPEHQKTEATHGVQLGKGAEYSHKCARPVYLDKVSKPYAVFTFKYRSKAVLENVIGRKLDKDTIKFQQEVETSRLQHLPKQKLIEELMKVKSPEIAKGGAASTMGGSTQGVKATDWAYKKPNPDRSGGGGAGGWNPRTPEGKGVEVSSPWEMVNKTGGRGGNNVNW